MTDPRDNIRRIVGKPLSIQARFGRALPSKHYDWKARLREKPPTPPVPCMYYVADRIGRICGDTETEWDRERETWLCNTHRKEINR